MWERCLNPRKGSISVVRKPEKLGAECCFSLCSGLNTVLLLVKGRWGGRRGGVGSGRQLAAFLAQNNLPCCCFGNLS